MAFVAHDYDETVRFFTDVMGLEVLRSFEDGGKGTILLAADGQLEVFAPGQHWGSPGVSGATLAWEVADADAEHARIVAAGGTVLGSVTTQVWGHKNFGVEGPDGWSITLFEVLNPQ